MVKYSKSIPNESIIEIKGTVAAPGGEIKGCSQQVEIHVSEIWTLNKSAATLPFTLKEGS